MKTERLRSIAYVANAHGLKGEIYVKFYSGSSTILEKLSSFALAKTPLNPTPYSLVTWSPFKQGALVQLENVSDRDAAESLVGQQVWVDEDLFPKTKPGEVYIKDLLGKKVIDGKSKQAVGTVENFEEGPGQLRLVILTTGGQRVEIPYCSAYFEDVPGDALVASHWQDYLDGMEEDPV